MPELAEVDYFRKQWNPGLGSRILQVNLHAGKRLFEGKTAQLLAQEAPGQILQASSCSGKWIMFQMKPLGWLALHMGMTGSLRIEPPHHKPAKHDHLLLVQARRSLIFNDPRLFGEVRYSHSAEPPAWWQEMPPAVLSKSFSPKAIAEYLQRRKGRPIKTVLLMQDRFPGIGNWMADEILWRAAIHPKRPSGSLSSKEIHALWRETRRVTRDALRVISHDWSDPPDSWLFNHRWKNGGRCPKTGSLLVRESIGGRTSCWSPAWQKAPAKALS